ncbi:MAG: hypothetical protein WBE11_12495, partial [Candidatus Aminicenantaceae bacterium]
VYGIVSKHKGTIDVKSDVGKGTTFFINLPVLNQEEWMKGNNKLVDMKKGHKGGEDDSKGKNLIGG